MNIKANKLFIIGIALTTMTACSDKDNVNLPVSGKSLYEEPVVEITNGRVVLSREEITVADASEKFAYNSLEQLSHRNPDANLLFSPSSLWMGLSLVANATGGNSYTQLTDAMGCSGLDIDVINDYNYKLNAALSEIDRNVEVTFANSLFSKTWIPMLESFSSRMEVAYGAEMFNFSISDSETADAINSWVRKHTNSRITNLVSQDETRKIDFAFLNAVYFDASWKSEFLTNQTTHMTFTNCDGSLSETDMLDSFGYFKHCVSDGVEYADIPFGDGSFSMTIALPADRTDGLDRILVSLKDRGLSGILATAEESLMTLRLPSFKTDGTTYMAEILKSMGVTDIFDEETSDFSRMTDDHCCLDLVKGYTVFEINEKGANGASSTILGGMALSNENPVETPVMSVDHPFIYLVTEKSTNTIIFIGVVNHLDPAK